MKAWSQKSRTWLDISLGKDRDGLRLSNYLYVAALFTWFTQSHWLSIKCVQCYYLSICHQLLWDQATEEMCSCKTVINIGCRPPQGIFLLRLVGHTHTHTHTLHCRRAGLLITLYLVGSQYPLVPSDLPPPPPSPVAEFTQRAPQALLHHHCYGLIWRPCHQTGAGRHSPAAAPKAS
jgi:hypothetical protein